MTVNRKAKKLLNRLFWTALTMAVILPVVVIYILTDSIHDLSVKDATSDAKVVAHHLASMFMDDMKELGEKPLSKQCELAQWSALQTFDLMKVKMFSKKGEIVFSTKPEDIGKLNNKDYFHKIVANGSSYTKYVKKKTKSAEDVRIDIDVVETYVPIMQGGAFLGAYEIYYDITEEKKVFFNTVYYVSSIILLISFGFITIVLFLSRKANAALKQQKQTENTLEKTNQYYKTVLDSLNDGVSIINPDDFRIVGVNIVFCKDHNKKEDEIIGKPCYEVTHGASHPCTPPDDPCPLRTTLKTGQHAIEEHIHYAGDGNKIHVEVSTSPIIEENGSISRIVHISRDISARKKAEKAIRMANQAKSEFLANMSHEIRTPLNAVIGMVEVLMDTEMDENQNNLFQIVTHESSALLNIINDILDFSKIEAGKLELEKIPFDLRYVVENVATSTAIRAKEKGLETISFLSPEVPFRLIGDPGRLRQILINLTGNAVKFTQKGEIFITGEMVEDLGDKIKARFSVIDTGIGIPKDKQGSIFEDFIQADGSTTRKYGGTGLGTTISKQLAELMEGEIGIKSKEGVGSTFWFTAVFNKDSNHMTDAAQTIEKLTGLNVLIIENNESNRLVLTEYLKSWGCYPKAFHDTEALSTLRALAATENHFDLILLGQATHPTDRFRYAEKIRGIDSVKNIPMIILTTVGEKGDAKRCKEIGIEGYLQKPVRKDELRKAIESVLNLSCQEEVEAKNEPITRHTLAEEQRRKIQILLAEDYPTNQQVALRHLKQAGYQVDLAENGQKAIDAFQRRQYDLILMDIQMPIMDGYESTAKIRHLESRLQEEIKGETSSEFQKIPIIAMTAHATQEHKQRCLETGMDDYIAKPLKRKELLAIVDKWIHPESTLIDENR